MYKESFKVHKLGLLEESSISITLQQRCDLGHMLGHLHTYTGKIITLTDYNNIISADEGVHYQKISKLQHMYTNINDTI